MSDDLEEVNEWADEVAEKHDARVKKRDRKVYDFFDDRAAELDRAVVNAKDDAKELEATAREDAKQARDRAAAKGKPPTARPGG
jgi:hypothetical protein